MFMGCTSNELEAVNSSFVWSPTWHQHTTERSTGAAVADGRDEDGAHLADLDKTLKLTWD